VDKIDTDSKDLGWLKRYADLLDSSIRIPGTNKTIGIDPILGLVPFLGDILGYIFSILLITHTLKSKPSPMLLMKMMGNITLDALLGSIPVLGSIFDFMYKANERNYRLFAAFKSSEKHRASVWPYFIGLLVFCSILVFLALWISYRFFEFLLSLF